jgi:hypothetical protein
LALFPSATLQVRAGPPDSPPRLMHRLEGADLPQYFVVRWFFDSAHWHGQSSHDELEKVLRETFALAPDSPAATTLIAEAAVVVAILRAPGLGPQDFATVEAFNRYQVERVLDDARLVGESFGIFLRDLREEGRDVAGYEETLRQNFGSAAALHYTDPDDRPFFLEVDRRFREAVNRELAQPPAER